MAARKPAGIADTLAEAFAILEIDAPEAYAAVAREIGVPGVRMDVAGEIFHVVSEAGAVTVLTSPHHGARARIETRRDAILAMIDGDKTVFQAVLDRDLMVTGELDFLSRLARAITMFAAASLSSRRMRGLLAAFRDADRG